MEKYHDAMNTTTKEHWKHETGDPIALLQPSQLYRAYFEKYFPKRQDWSVVEVGACPGGHLLALALSHGYKPVALDYLPDVHRLPEKFREYGIENLEVMEADFLTFETDRRFNIVMSFGFLEHFRNPEDILALQWKLVAPGGFLLVGVPVFGPLQMLLRRSVLTPEKLAWTLGAHNMKIMDMQVLRDACKALPNCSNVIMSSYVREMEMWFSRSDAHVRKERVWILYVWRVLALLPKWLNLSCKLFSPYSIVIVRRKPNGGMLKESE